MTLIHPDRVIQFPSVSSIQAYFSQITLTEWLCTRIAEIASACALAHPEHGPALFDTLSQVDARILAWLECPPMPQSHLSSDGAQESSAFVGTDSSLPMEQPADASPTADATLPQTDAPIGAVNTEQLGREDRTRRTKKETAAAGTATRSAAETTIDTVELTGIEAAIETLSAAETEAPPGIVTETDAAMAASPAYSSADTEHPELVTLAPGEALSADVAPPEAGLSTDHGRDDGWQCDHLHYGEFIGYLKEFEERLQVLRDRKRRIDDKRDHITRQIGEVQGLLPDTPSSIAAILSTSEQTLPLAALEQSTDAIEQQLAELLMALRQLPVLGERLGRAVSLQAPLPTDLPSLKTAAAATVGAWQYELRQIGEREQAAADLCDRLCRSTLGLAHDAAAILAQADVVDLHSTVRFLDDGQIYTPAGQTLKRLCGQSNVIGALIAIAWQGDETQTKLLLAERIARHIASPTPNWRSSYNLLGFLREDQLVSLGGADPSLQVILASAFFLEALHRNDAQGLTYIKPWLDLPAFDRACGDFFRAVLQAHYQGIQLRSLSGLDSPSATVIAKINEARAKVEMLVNTPPGMDRTFHRMRVYARERYLLPLRTFLATDNADGAHAYWRELGSLERLAEDCGANVSDRRVIDEIHVKKTREYLEECERLITVWHTLEQARPRLHQDPRVEASLTTLRQSRTRPSVLLATAIEHVRVAPNHPTQPAAAVYGQSKAPDREGRLIYGGHFVPTPMHVRAFVAHVNCGEIPLPALLADWVAEALGRQIATRDELVHYLLLQDELKAAKMAANSEALHIQVDNIVQQRTHALLSQYQDVFIEAKTNRANDDMLGLCLDDIEQCMSQMQFEAAKNSLDLLSNEVRRFRLETDPEYQDAAHFLGAAGYPIVGKPDKASLLLRVKALRDTNETRRQHLFPLEFYAAECSRLRDALTRLRERIDRPNRWPTAARSDELAKQFDTLLKFTQGQLEFSKDATELDRFVERLPLWLGAQLDGDAVDGKVASSAATLTQVVGAIDRFAPLSHIMTLLGTPPPPSDVPPRRPDVHSPSHLISPQRRLIDRPSQEEVLDRVHALHQTLKDQAQRLPPSPSGDMIASLAASTVTSAIAEGNWLRVLQLTAARINARASEVPRRDMTLPFYAALFAVALARESRTEALRERGTRYRRACLSLLLCPDHKKEQPEPPLLSQAIIEAYKSLGDVAQSTLEGVFLTLAELPPDELSCRWFSELLWDAAQHQIAPKPGNLQLVDDLWELLQGHDPKFRAALLKVLYRLRQFDAVRHLAHHVRASEDLIATCVTAFERAESDPEVRPTARELVAAFRENRAGQHNTRPWDLLFGYLETPSRTGNAPLVICELTDQDVYPSGVDSIEIQLSLIPGYSADPPEQLSIELATAESHITQQEVVTKNEYLLKQKLVSLPLQVPEYLLQKEDLLLNYRLTGETVQNRPIDERGQLTLLIRHGSGTPLQEHELADLWPGASGEPVRATYFVGRERDLKTIEDHIRADTRQRSVMMMGQRRIGKTSLLLELTERFPPAAGKVCGAFADVAGLELPPGKSMQEQLFDFLITAIDSQEVNARIRKTIRNGRDMRRIARDLKPELSLNNALEQFVKRLGEESNEVIKRIAFFIDEFDRFVQPLLSDRRSEVDKLMWSIRQIVQQSTCISVVLAGSGLQQLFTEHYEDALFGSIDHVRLRPFRWEDDRAAIQDTFLPQQVRARLGGDSENLERVVRYANDFCDGHPFFLNVLGRSAAFCSKGRPLTVSLLNRTVERMLAGGLSTGGTEVDAKRFYGHVFETLAKLPKAMQAVAKLAFAHLASRTTTEYPTRPLSELLDAPELLDEKARGLRDAALSHLQKEQAIMVDSHRGIERVRISVPLTAAAVRWDAQVIRQQSMAELRRQ